MTIWYVTRWRMLMRIGIVRERHKEETRVALVPQDIKRLKSQGHEIFVEKGAGFKSGYLDEAYASAGATMVDGFEAVYQNAQLIAKVNRPSLGPDDQEISLLQQGQTLVSMMQALYHPQDAEEVAQTGATAYALELVPRITRAQKMDALSSMANIAGYKAVLMAADHLGKVMPMLMTAAGTMKPAKALVIGAGVAGLQAIATAKRLGAVVEAFDTRPVVKDQVESLGAKFVDVPLTEAEKKEAEDRGGYARKMSDDYYRRQQEILAEKIRQADLVVTTAQIFGRKAPTIISKTMVESMKEGSVVVDLAIETGGNCEVAEAGKIIKHGPATVIGMVNLPALVPEHASQMYSRNIVEFIANLTEIEDPAARGEDEILRDTLLCEQGKLVHEGTLGKLKEGGIS